MSSINFLPFLDRGELGWVSNNQAASCVHSQAILKLQMEAK